MTEWLRAQVANGFSGFSGTAISASVRVSESLLNELLAETLKDAIAPHEPMPPDAASHGLSEMLKLITSTELRVVDGALTINLEIRV